MNDTFALDDLPYPVGTPKPCPFCGERPTHIRADMNGGGKWGRVVCCCEGPDVRTGYGPPEEWAAEAVNQWNQRWEPLTKPERRLQCCVCAKYVSTFVPKNTVVRAWIECPECTEKQSNTSDEP